MTIPVTKCRHCRTPFRPKWNQPNSVYCSIHCSDMHQRLRARVRKGKQGILSGLGADLRLLTGG